MPLLDAGQDRFGLRRLEVGDWSGSELLARIRQAAGGAGAVGAAVPPIDGDGVPDELVAPPTGSQTSPTTTLGRATRLVTSGVVSKTKSVADPALTQEPSTTTTSVPPTTPSTEPPTTTTQPRSSATTSTTTSSSSSTTTTTTEPPTTTPDGRQRRRVVLRAPPPRRRTSRAVGRGTSPAGGSAEPLRDRTARCVPVCAVRPTRRRRPDGAESATVGETTQANRRPPSARPVQPGRPMQPSLRFLVRRVARSRRTPGTRF